MLPPAPPAFAVIELSPFQLGLAAALILVNAAVSIALRLDLEKRLFLAALRTLVQLTLLSLVLKWVFAADSEWAILGVMLFMALVAGIEAVRRTNHRVRGIYAASMGVMLVSSMSITFYGIAVVIRAEPWTTPQYAIPILGMVLGNTLTGISLGLETVLEGFLQERAQIEVLLAHGATPAEAGRRVVQRAVRKGMVPILNSMIAVGLVSIPGMMTGQILAGEDPSNAGRYQIFILFLIAGCTAIGTMSMVLAAKHLVFDERQRLRTDRIRALKDA